MTTEEYEIFIKIAEKYGAKISEYENEKDGIFYIDKDGNEKEIDIYDAFPEFKRLKE